jgi:hypothetical protein
VPVPVPGRVPVQPQRPEPRALPERRVQPRLPERRVQPGRLRA